MCEHEGCPASEGGWRTLHEATVELFRQRLDGLATVELAEELRGEDAIILGRELSPETFLGRRRRWRLRFGGGLIDSQRSGHRALTRRVGGGRDAGEGLFLRAFGIESVLEAPEGI